MLQAFIRSPINYQVTFIVTSFFLLLQSSNYICYILQIFGLHPINLKLVIFSKESI